MPFQKNNLAELDYYPNICPTTSAAIPTIFTAPKTKSIPIAIGVISFLTSALASTLAVTYFIPNIVKTIIEMAVLAICKYAIILLKALPNPDPEIVGSILTSFVRSLEY